MPCRSVTSLSPSWIVPSSSISLSGRHHPCSGVFRGEGIAQASARSGRESSRYISLRCAERIVKQFPPWQWSNQKPEGRCSGLIGSGCIHLSRPRIPQDTQNVRSESYQPDAQKYSDVAVVRRSAEKAKINPDGDPSRRVGNNRTTELRTD